jgi:hypothetical protein
MQYVVPQFHTANLISNSGLYLKLATKYLLNIVVDLLILTF